MRAPKRWVRSGSSSVGVGEVERAEVAGGRPRELAEHAAERPIAREAQARPAGLELVVADGLGELVAELAGEPRRCRRRRAAGSARSESRGSCRAPVRAHRAAGGRSRPGRETGRRSAGRARVQSAVIALRDDREPPRHAAPDAIGRGRAGGEAEAPVPAPSRRGGLAVRAASEIGGTGARVRSCAAPRCGRARRARGSDRGLGRRHQQRWSRPRRYVGRVLVELGQEAQQMLAAVRVHQRMRPGEDEPRRAVRRPRASGGAGLAIGIERRRRARDRRARRARRRASDRSCAPVAASDPEPGPASAACPTDGVAKAARRATGRS